MWFSWSELSVTRICTALLTKDHIRSGSEKKQHEPECVEHVWIVIRVGGEAAFGVHAAVDVVDNCLNVNAIERAEHIQTGDAPVQS